MTSSVTDTRHVQSFTTLSSYINNDRPMLSTRHCPHSPSDAAACYRYFLAGAVRRTNETDRQTDGHHTISQTLTVLYMLCRQRQQNNCPYQTSLPARGRLALLLLGQFDYTPFSCCLLLAIMYDIHKLEVLNIAPLQDDRAMVNIHTNLVKIGRVVPDICLQTNRQTNGHTHRNT